MPGVEAEGEFAACEAPDCSVGVATVEPTFPADFDVRPVGKAVDPKCFSRSCNRGLCECPDSAESRRSSIVTDAEAEGSPGLAAAEVVGRVGPTDLAGCGFAEGVDWARVAVWVPWYPGLWMGARTPPRIPVGSACLGPACIALPDRCDCD